MDELVARLRRASSVAVLTGSGISAESGLPTFRGAGGMWRANRVEDLATPEGFARDPRLVWSWYNERTAAHHTAEPNAGHVALAELERRFADFTLITQNVDSLHLRAGSRNLVELHGNLREARCTVCDSRRPLPSSGLPLEEIEHECGGRLRPNVVWFGEALPDTEWRRAERAVRDAEVLLIVGTSAVVYPAAALASFGTAFLAEINPESTPISDAVDVVLRETAAQALPRIIASL
jgi:NAD-dependent protein deacetylase/lipoamidase